MRKAIYKLNKQGSLVFPLRNDLLQDAYKVESFWERPAVSLFVLILCSTLDYVVFAQTFSIILYDKVLLQRLSVIGCLIGFDLGPVYLGLSRRKATQGLRVDKLGCALLVTAFLTMVAFNTYLRVVLKDQLVPASSAAAFSVFNTGAAESNPAALPYAIFSSILPVATSIVSFYVSLVSSNPLKSRLMRLRKEQIELEDAISQLEAILEEYAHAPELEARLLNEDKAMYLNALAMAKEQGFYLCDYVRERLKEHLGDATAMNLLSSDVRGKLEALCQPPKVNAGVPVTTVNVYPMEKEAG
ncbi:MAG: hypothetical protein J5633_03470 [Oscillospiraceae bacterium]|nr:hypothetical protein [Oscillospiraceae bacterium]